MTIDTNNLLKLRKSYLDSLNDIQAETGLLQQMLEELRSSHPMLFDDHESDDAYAAVDGNPLNWTDQYFSRQKKLAERNFSLVRVNHLIQMRDHFRKEGRKGFVPKTQEILARPPHETESGYRPSNNLRKFVDEGDLQTLRTALSMELEDSDLDERALRSAAAWVKSRVPALFDSYSEKGFARAFECDRLHWTADYYSKQSVYLDTNFAEERFLHLVEVREYLRAQDAKAHGKTAANPRPAVTSGPAAKTSATAASADQHQPHPSASVWSHPRRLSPTFIAALLIGGALATVAILILALKK